MSTPEDKPSPAASTTADDHFQYSIEERVLCYHGPLIYEAKCLKRRKQDNKNQYFVHYNGWNKNWDEWVGEDRILKLNSQNQKIQQELKTKHKLVNSSSASSSSSSSKKRKGSSVTSSQDSSNGKDGPNGSNEKRQKTDSQKSDPKNPINISANAKDGPNSEIKEEKKKKKHLVPPFVETEEAFNSKIEIKIRIPEELKPCLVDDWDLITRQQKLFELPAKITVEYILDDYLKQKLATKLTPIKESQVNEVIDGIKGYFNSMLGSQLLYRFERLQYQELLTTNPGKKMSELYGSVHLLRLFTKFGHFLAFTAMDEKTIQVLLIHFNDFLKYLSRNSQLFSSNDYSVASPEYLRQTI